jgi:hypothetical protein
MRRLVRDPAADKALADARVAQRSVLVTAAGALLAACRSDASLTVWLSGWPAPAMRSAVTRGGPRPHIQDAHVGLWHAHVLAARAADYQPGALSRYATGHALTIRTCPLYDNHLDGVMQVVVCTLVFAGGWLHAGNRRLVLALTRLVTAGQVITAADLRTVRVSAAGPVSRVPASRQGDAAAGSRTAPAGYFAPGTGELRACRYRQAKRCLDVAAEQFQQALARARAISPAGPTDTTPANGRGFDRDG